MQEKLFFKLIFKIYQLKLRNPFNSYSWLSHPFNEAKFYYSGWHIYSK